MGETWPMLLITISAVSLGFIVSLGWYAILHSVFKQRDKD